MSSFEGYRRCLYPIPDQAAQRLHQEGYCCGKHIYSEKPLVGSVEELAELIATCEKAGCSGLTEQCGTTSHPCAGEGLCSGEREGDEMVLLITAPDEAWFEEATTGRIRTRTHGRLGDMGTPRTRPHRNCPRPYVALCLFHELPLTTPRSSYPIRQPGHYPFCHSMGV